MVVLLERLLLRRHPSGPIGEPHVAGDLLDSARWETPGDQVRVPFDHRIPEEEDPGLPVLRGPHPCLDDLDPVQHLLVCGPGALPDLGFEAAPVLCVVVGDDRLRAGFGPGPIAAGDDLEDVPRVLVDGPPGPVYLPV